VALLTTFSTLRVRFSEPVEFEGRTNILQLHVHSTGQVIPLPIGDQHIRTVGAGGQYIESTFGLDPNVLAGVSLTSGLDSLRIVPGEISERGGINLQKHPENRAVPLVLITNQASILSGDRLIPTVPTDTEPDVSIFAPINQLADEFTVGPNPTDKRSGDVMNFFWRGKRINNATLTIFDAIGNAINTIVITDNPIFHTQNSIPRLVGSWDLTDRNGRPVSEGVYLVRGFIVTAGERREYVSIVVGVR
jgi:hypothetical protein